MALQVSKDQQIRGVGGPGDGQQLFQQAQPQIQQLAQKVQQAKQAAIQQAAEADPTAQVILKTQMAETERKAKEAEAKMQLEVQKIQQDSQLKIAELQQKVQELMAKYETQTQLDANKNATMIALANINNSAKERIAQITAGAQFDTLQAQLEHEQNLSAMEAIRTAESDIRQHGLAVRQQVFDQQTQQVQSAIDAQQAQQQHVQGLQQAQQQQAALGAPLQQQGQQQIAQAQAGQLTPQSQAAYQAAQARINQNIANRGGTGVQQAANELSNIYQSLLANQYQLGQQILNIGELENIIVTNIGKGYNRAPITEIYQKGIASLGKI